METKVKIQKDPLSEEDFRKLNDIQQQAEDTNTVQDEKDILQNIECCFEGFCEHKCLCINCIVLLTFSLVISILIAVDLSAILLGAYGNIQEDICRNFCRLFVFSSVYINTIFYFLARVESIKVFLSQDLYFI
jgi:hypothetical protein